MMNPYQLRMMKCIAMSALIVLFYVSSAFAQNPKVQNGVATYTANKNIGRKFKVPAGWNKILIKENVTITGSFFMPTRNHPIEIAGENRKTSILQGDGSRPTDDGIKGRTYSAIRCDKSPDLYVHDLKVTKPMKFHIHGGFGNVTVERCDIIAGSHTHTTDGIHGGRGKTVVKDCYIDVYDDALYTIECKLVENTTIVHNKNGGPFMTSWGASVPNNHVCVIRNCTVIDNYDQTNYNHGIFSWAGKSDNGKQTIHNKIEGTFTHKVNPGKKASPMYTIGRPNNGGISDAVMKIDGTCLRQGSVDLRQSKNSQVIFVNCDGGGNNNNNGTSITDINDLKITSIACDKVVLSWGDVNGEDAYRIRRKVSGEATFTTLGDVNANVKTYADNTVAENTTYIYQVRPMVDGKAVKTSNNPTASVPKCSTGECNGGPNPAATTSKTNPTCKNDNGTIKFSFDDTQGRTGIEFSINGGQSYLPQVADNSNSFTASNLAAGSYNTYVRWGNNECPIALGKVNLTKPTNCDSGNDCNGGPQPSATTSKTNPSCTADNGKIKFSFDDTQGRTGIEFSINGGLSYLQQVADNSGSFTTSNLAAGSYSTYVRWGNNECPVELGKVSLTKPTNCNGGGSTCEGFEEKDGLIVMEAESTTSNLGKWIAKKDVNGYTGSGHLEFTGNNQASGPATSPLTYSFTVNKAGSYRLIIKSRKRLAGAEADKSNDCYVKLEGDFNASSNACGSHNCDAQKADLTKNMKFFGGNATNWGWAQQLDLGGHDNKRNAVYRLKAGKTYVMTVSGRSKNYNFDKIVFFDQSKYTLAEAKSKSFGANETNCSNDGNNGGGGDCTPWFSSNGVWKGKGRIAISSDGNEHDKDDWAATPFSLALLAAKGLQDQLTLYTYSDHVWGSNHDHSDARQQMRTSALVGADKFGFDRSRFMEAVANPTAAYNAMAAEINKSTATNPLIIVAAGPMQVVGEGLNRANQNKLKFVTVISHSNWNDRHSDNSSGWENHTGWTWDEMKNKFQSKGTLFDHITDQNGGNGYDGMRANASKFSWLNNSPARNNPLYESGSWAWLYGRQEAAKKGTEFDPSDAGMIIYMLTGKEKTDPADARAIMENPVKSCLAVGKADVVLAMAKPDEVVVSIYPNPSFNDFMVSLSNGKVVESMTILDVSGVPVPFEYKVEGSNITVNNINVPAGMYFLKLTTDEGVFTETLFKE